MNRHGRFIVAAAASFDFNQGLPIAFLDLAWQSTLQAQVLIVGAGPVGLTLAMDLAQRGIDVLVAETRHRGEPPNVKCNHVSARSMEIFRRLGVAQRAARRGPAGRLPERRRLPHHLHRRGAVAHSHPGAQGPLHRDRRPRHLVAHARAAAPHQPDLPGAGAVRACRGDAGRAHPEPHAHRRLRAGRRRRARRPACDLDTGERRCRSAASYLVGCDGGRSGVRKKIGAKLSGTDVVGRVQSTFFRAPDLLQRAPAPAGLGDLLAQPAPQRQRLRHRRPRDLPAAQLPEGRRDRLRGGRPRLGDPHHPRRRRRLPLRDHQQGRLGRPPPGGRQASATAACSSAATPRTCGSRWPATA